MKHWKTLALAAALVFAPMKASAQTLDESLNRTFDALIEHVGLTESEAALSALGDLPADITADTLAHLLVLRRHFDQAAWYFALESTSAPDAASLSNLSAMLVQLVRDAPEDWPDNFLETALAASRRAAELAPERGEIWNNLGNAARAAGHLEEAVAAHRRASELNPNEPLFWTNLARALEALGDTAGAAEALARAHALAPNAPEVRFLIQSLPPAPAYSEAIRRVCEVDFRCQEICPRSIIGGLMSVQCEMENMSANMACSEGRPYPTAYECSEDFPEYGILIPGLNAGFSIVAPGIEVHVLFNGDGNIDVRWEAGINLGAAEVYVGSDGHYNGAGGDVVVDNFGAGGRVVLLPKDLSNLDVGDNIKIPVAYSQMGPGDGTPGEIRWLDFNEGLVFF